MTVNHNHFRDLTYNVNIQAKNMLVYDIPKKTNPMIYGSAFGTGTTTIQGSGKLINFDINLRSDPKTAITLNFMHLVRNTDSFNITSFYISFK